jgi:hypothetical protein
MVSFTTPPPLVRAPGSGDPGLSQGMYPQLAVGDRDPCHGKVVSVPLETPSGAGHAFGRSRALAPLVAARRAPRGSITEPRGF